MTSLKRARYRVAIAGFVNDQVTTRAVAGANVTILQAPQIFVQKLRLIGLQFGTAWNTKTDRPDKTQTRQDGSFYFLDLPVGAYTLQASPLRLGKRGGFATADVKVEQNEQGSFMLNWITLSLPSTLLSGTVTNNKSAVSFAEVRVQGSGEHTFSDGQGRYSLAGLEPGNRTVLVNAQGFSSVSQSVLIPAPGDSPTLDFQLLRNVG